MPNVNYIHGESGGRHSSQSSEISAWKAMISRCENHNNQSYKWYGGKGIKVCDRWRNDYTKFLEDMGRKPTPKHTLGRLNDKGDYDPLNCEWQTWTKQLRTSKNAKLTMVKAREIRMLYGRGYSSGDLAKEFGVTRTTICNVINGVSWKEGEE